MKIARIVFISLAFIAAVVSVTGTSVAEPGHDWDAVAWCESAGDWHISTGNGYYGGLQFLSATWWAYGGGPGLPHEYTREEQIRVAENVLAGQGPGAWPVCGRYL
ncbi:transglycosylase family protein [Nocardia terpenica]|uniref:Transglycosylase n=1 Tax=Nocardia terpenica TaxID=455432 RepID=A0A6G9ZD21_9NOCA|nr:transglycosylase family protein [Nocardia terpenica]QIS23402.1 transglycosylase [Nocardia terpenica]